MSECRDQVQRSLIYNQNILNGYINHTPPPPPPPHTHTHTHTYAQERGNISRLHIKFNESDPADLKGRYSHRIYGYLIPPIPGNYSFKVELSNMTAAGSVELWINNDKILYLVYDDTVSEPNGVLRVVRSKGKRSKTQTFKKLVVDIDCLCCWKGMLSLSWPGGKESFLHISS